MVKHLSSKGGMFLSETCFVFGDKRLHYDFQKIAAAELKKQRSNKKTIKSFQKQLLKDLKKFDLEKNFDIYFLHKMNIKKTLYRNPTIFLSHYSNFLGYFCLSSFDTITKLRKENLILKDLEHKLKYIVAISCKARLKAYEKQQKQDVEVKLCSMDYKKKALKFDLLEKKCVIDFFRIAMGIKYNFSTLSLSKKKKYCIEDDTNNNIFYECLVCFLLGLFERCWLLLSNNPNQLKTKNNRWEKNEVVCVAGISLFVSYEKVKAKRMLNDFVLKHYSRKAKNTSKANKKIYSVYSNCSNEAKFLWRSIIIRMPFEFDLPLEFINYKKQFRNGVNNFFLHWKEREERSKTIKTSIWEITFFKYLFAGIINFYSAVQKLQWSLVKKRLRRQIPGRSNRSFCKRSAEHTNMQQPPVKKKRYKNCERVIETTESISI